MTQHFSARSWLFAPADSDRKMEKAAEGPADIAIFDLEDSVAHENKPAARERVADFLRNAERRQRLWVRINPISTTDAERDLDAVMAGAPGGIMLPKSLGRGDVERLSGQLHRLEAEHAIAHGSTKVIALVTETPAAMFTTGDYAALPRLAAMSWGAEDLGSALGATQRMDEDGNYLPVFELARSLCLLGAAAAEVAPIETIMADFRDLEGLRQRARLVRRQGYRGMLAIHPAQVEPINEAFTPSDEELAEAREIVALFEANPDVGTIGHKGAMLDRPHLVQAKALLGMAGK